MDLFKVQHCGIKKNVTKYSHTKPKQMKIKVWPVIDSNMQSHFFTFFLCALAY